MCHCVLASLGMRHVVDEISELIHFVHEIAELTDELAMSSEVPLGYGCVNGDETHWLII